MDKLYINKILRNSYFKHF